MVVTVLIHILQQRIEEPIPHNFKRLLAGRLRSLVSLGKLEKVYDLLILTLNAILG